MRNKSRNIWLIVSSAFVVTILANVGLFNHFHKLYVLEEVTEASKEQYQFLLKIGSVSVATELVMLVVFAFFNYSWKDFIIRKKNVFLIIISNIVLLALFMCIDIIISRHITETHPNREFSLFYLKDYFINHSLVLTISIVAPYMLLRMEKSREMELKLNKIKEEKSIAELSALKEQINPHFFFNTLSTLSSIVRSESKKESLEFIDDISSTYRYSLSSTKKNLVTLKEELNFIKSYTDLLQKRFGEKLKITLNISNEIYNSNIPPMSIQLLIENAIQHNIITTVNPLYIKVYNENGYICVENNLQEKKDVESFGIGLMNLNNRYKLITNKEIQIEKKSNHFFVKLPVLL